MPIKCNKETFSSEKTTAYISAQSVVECRFPGDIVTILAVNAAPVPTSCRVDNGEVEYRGRVLLTVVYEDGDKNVCRTERGLEFSHRAEHENCTPASKAFVSLAAIKVSTRRDGSGVYVTAVVGADITVVAKNSFEYVSDGEGFISRKEEVPFITPFFAEGEIETDDEFDCEYIGDVLLHTEKASVSSISAEDGVIAVSGEIGFSVCALKKDGSLSSYERLIPFRGEIGCDGASAKTSCDASVFISSVSVNAETDEEKGTCRIRSLITMRVRATAYSESKLSVVADAFSVNNKLSVVTQSAGGEYLADIFRFTERASSSAFISSADNRGITFADSLQAVVLGEASASVVKTDGKEYAEGAVTAKVIVADADSSHRSIDITLPFSVPVNASAEGRKEVDVLPCGLAVKQRKEGEIEAEATLKICVKVYGNKSAAYVGDISEGEPVPAKSSAFSVYMASAGEDLWQTAKRLNKSPEEIEKCNPDLKFPLSGNERIIVYRKN